ncbi:hypothetical protein PG985_001401 [Apiospora marii]|uniref:GATA-type domain-containing protein n=1 Tax=Apiospora marii TaxID=335849 RepID=A0ABR1RHU4_9PEZI
MASIRQQQQQLPHHQHEHGDPNNAHDLPSSSRRPFLPTPNSTDSLDLSNSILSTIKGDPILIENAVRKLRPGYAYASFEKVHEDTQELLGLIQQTRDGHRHGARSSAYALPSDRDLAALTSTAQGLVNKLQSIRQHRHSTLSRRTRRAHRPCDHYRHPDDTNAAAGGEGGQRFPRPPAVPGTHSPCDDCNRTKTPEWRAGPTGPEALCNVCGLLYAKRLYRMQNRK